jgi:RNA-directed DNA polymerase
LLLGNQRSAQAVMAALPERFAAYGLRLHPEKTRLIDFRRPPRDAGGVDSRGPGSFDLLGFTHYWGKSRRGFWVILRKTSKSRIRRTLRDIWEWCRNHRHHPLRWQAAKMRQKLMGHAAYFGVAGNSRALQIVWPVVPSARWRGCNSRRGRREQHHR